MKLWEEIYSDIQNIFGYPDKYTQASSNIISEADDSVLFDLLKIKRAA